MQQFEQECISVKCNCALANSPHLTVNNKVEHVGEGDAEGPCTVGSPSRTSFNMSREGVGPCTVRSPSSTSFNRGWALYVSWGRLAAGGWAK